MSEPLGPGPHTKGASLRSDFKFLKHRLGEPGFNALLAGMTPAEQAVLAHVLPHHWVSIPVMGALTRAAAPLTPEQEATLKADLHDTFQLEPILDVKIDPTLLGGMVVQVGDWRYDGSVRNRLEQLRNQLLVKSHDQIQSRRNRFSHSG